MATAGGVLAIAGFVGLGKTSPMTNLALRCPRCKQDFSDDDADRLADDLIAHLELEHGHAPPREHVLHRIERNNPTT